MAKSGQMTPSLTMYYYTCSKVNEPKMRCKDSKQHHVMFHELYSVSLLLCIAQNAHFEIPYKVLYLETPFLIIFKYYAWVSCGRTLRERFGEHLRSIEKKSPGFPVAEHFNGLDHTLSDAEIRGIKLCTGNNIHRKRLEMRLIFRLGTARPRGMNINFSFI